MTTKTRKTAKRHVTPDFVVELAHTHSARLAAAKLAGMALLRLLEGRWDDPALEPARYALAILSHTTDVPTPAKGGSRDKDKTLAMEDAERITRMMQNRVPEGFVIPKPG